MMHRQRRWCLASVCSPEELARMLTERTWTLCAGFTVAGHEDYVFLNDATSENGAQEYAVIDRFGPQQYAQIESVTFSWCSAEQALAHIRLTLEGEFDDEAPAHFVPLALETPEQHRCCDLRA